MKKRKIEIDEERTDEILWRGETRRSNYHHLKSRGARRERWRGGGGGQDVLFERNKSL